MTDEEIYASEIKFNIVMNEIVFCKEVESLWTLTRETIFWKNVDTPLYIRRQYNMIISRIKKYSHMLCRDLEEDWQGSDSIALHLDRIYHILDLNINTTVALCYVAYCEILHEFRFLIKNAAEKDETYVTKVYSSWFHGEKTLAPLQRLMILRNNLKSLILLENGLNQFELEKCQASLDNITGVLDRCFEVLESLHGSVYTSKIEQLLEFGLLLSSTKFKESKKRTSRIHSTSALMEKPYRHDQFSSHVYSKTLPKNKIKKHKDESVRLEFLEGVSYHRNVYHQIFNPSYSSEDTQDSSLYEDMDSSSTVSMNRMCHCSIGPSSDAHLPLPSESSKPPAVFDRNSFLRQSFVEGPLYQFYTLDSVDTKNDVHCQCSDSGDYEGIIFRSKYARTFWCEVEPVISSGVLSNLSPKQRILQEAKFEIITSEVSYLKSLHVLFTVFYESNVFRSSITEVDLELLFGNIWQVRKAAECFLHDLAGDFRRDIFLNGICHTVREHAETSFRVYVDFCAHQLIFQSTLQRLMRTNQRFQDVLKDLEVSKECQGYSLLSFLTLPMQRITRLPLLIDAIQKKLSPDTEEFAAAKEAFSALQKLAIDCNEEVRKCGEKLNIDRLMCDELAERISGQLQLRKATVPCVRRSTSLCQRFHNESTPSVTNNIVPYAYEVEPEEDEFFTRHKKKAVQFIS